MCERDENTSQRELERLVAGMLFGVGFDSAMTCHGMAAVSDFVDGELRRSDRGYLLGFHNIDRREIPKLVVRYVMHEAARVMPGVLYFLERPAVDGFPYPVPGRG